MRRRLLFKLVVSYLVIALSMFTLLNTLGRHQLQKYLMDNQKNILYNEAVIIASEYMEKYYKGNMTLDNLNTELEVIDTFINARIWFVSRGGSILLDSRAEVPNSSNINALDPSFLETRFHENTTVKGLLNKPCLSVVNSVSSDFSIKGYIVIHYDLSLLRENSIKYIDIVNICYLIFLLIMLGVFITIYYITVIPLKRIINTTKEYASGHFDYEMNINSTDEYKDLADAITYMASELNNLDDYQKKFVANISHDFRSPLTSIKGYAEAILDGTIPVEMQDKYLNIILFETERLTKLTTSLLTLNSFENKGVILDITTFDINNIIKKTAETFEGICTKKKITLNLVFSEKVTLVEADMSKIQQVLYNLIDNAIKFSNQNSKIKVTTEEKNDKIFISVKDYGLGISKENIKKIWDRFYKIDTSRGKDKKGTGLGLSITKEIINAHNENINVTSTEGVGTEFTFSLPKGYEK